jgi:hypothetical protein
VPFGHPIIDDIIRTQWFGKGRADVQTYKKMVGIGKVPEFVIILVVTAVRVRPITGLLLMMANLLLQVENALMEWSSGDHIALQFSDDAASSR